MCVSIYTQYSNLCITINRRALVFVVGWISASSSDDVTVSDADKDDDRLRVEG